MLPLSDQGAIDYGSLSQAEANVRAGASWVQGKADATVRQESSVFNQLNRLVDNIAELAPLFIGDGCMKILDFDQAPCVRKQSAQVVRSR